MRLIIFYSFIVTSISAFAQDSLYVEGIYIKKYNKEDIFKKQQNENFKQQGKSYQIATDYDTHSFFFTLNADSIILLMKEEDIETIICSNQNYKNMEIYKFPPFNSYEYNFFGEKSIIESIHFPRDCDYYFSRNDTTHIYNIYYVSGNAIRIEISNDSLNSKKNFILAHDWDITPSTINKNIPSFYVYLFYKINIIECKFPLKGFEKWNKN
jgi:hypothetical protein